VLKSFQTIEISKIIMSKDTKKDLGESSSSSSSNVGLTMAGLGINPIFSQPRLPPNLIEARVRTDASS
jgi:hypothetical protein